MREHHGLLKVEGLGKRYGAEGPLACRNVSFSISDGEFVSIVGPSGCGKTTLLRMIAGLLSPSSGRVLFKGQPVEGPPPEMVLVFQDYSRSLFPWLTTRKNVMFPLKKHRELSTSEKEERVMSALESVGLDHATDKYPWQLSGGMQQRVAIARALSFRPRVLLLDEPFASVDALTRADLEDLVLSVLRQGGYNMTVLLVTHDIEEAVYMSDRVIVLSSPPSTVQEAVDVQLPRPRSQLRTRSEQAFLNLRERIHSLIAHTPNGIDGQQAR